MARLLYLDKTADDIHKALARSFQSGYLNFLFGSGASFPAMPIAGSIEQEIADLYASGKESEAQLKMYEFLAGLQSPTNKLIEGVSDKDIEQTLGYYDGFLGAVETIIEERRSTLLPKQATVFTTNYDLLIEKAALRYPAVRLNDGFSRVPSLDGRMEYSSRTFFTTTSNTGNLYNYKVDIPCVNLVKLHGSFSWKKDHDDILFSVAKRDLLTDPKAPVSIGKFIEPYAVVLPQSTKFRTTLMDRTYYELLRIYANELDRENTLVVAFGFSFGDEHIFGITKRALKNPTLKLVAFAFNDADKTAFASKFDGHNNVDIIAMSGSDTIDFQRFNEVIRSCLPGGGKK